jgi:hypothetical protein
MMKAPGRDRGSKWKGWGAKEGDRPGCTTPDNEPGAEAGHTLADETALPAVPFRARGADLLRLYQSWDQLLSFV